jgi:hypothetical protein
MDVFFPFKSGIKDYTEVFYICWFKYFCFVEGKDNYVAESFVGWFELGMGRLGWSRPVRFWFGTILLKNPGLISVNFASV